MRHLSIQDALILLARVFAGIESQKAAMTSVDRLGFLLRFEDSGLRTWRPHCLPTRSGHSGRNQKSSGGDGAAGASTVSKRVRHSVTCVMGI
jgi:hypothetical protein